VATGYARAYGLEIAGGRLVLARVQRRGAPQVVLAAPADSDEARRAVASAAREAEQGHAALAVCVPAAQTVVRRLRAPFASAQKAAKVWPSLLDVELPFPVEGALCAYGEPRVEDGGTVALAAAIRKGDVEAFDGACRAAGFEPTHADAEALALWDQLGEDAPPVRPEQPRAIVWLGADHVALVRGRGTEFMAAHVLRASPLGAGSDARQIFSSLWASRIGPVLSAHAAETESSEMDLWWAGPGADDESLAADLRRLLPAGLALRHETLRQPASFLARALARRAAAGRGVNFKVGEFSNPARLRTETRRLRLAHLGVVAAAVLVLALNLGESVLRRRRDDALQRRLTEAALAIAGPGVPRGQEGLAVERALVRRDEETQPFRDALDPAGLEGRLILALEEVAALELEVSRLTMSPLAVAIEGSAVSIQAIEGLAERMRAQGWAVQSDTPGRTPEGRPRFILKGARHHEG
jgi:hypothetical protein